MRQNIQYTIKKPYKMVIKNRKKGLKFSTCEIFRVIFEKVVFLKNEGMLLSKTHRGI